MPLLQGRDFNVVSQIKFIKYYNNKLLWLNIIKYPQVRTKAMQYYFSFITDSYEIIENKKNAN